VNAVKSQTKSTHDQKMCFMSKTMSVKCIHNFLRYIVLPGSH